MPRRRTWLLWILGPLALLAGLAGAGWWFVQSRTLAERIEAAFADRVGGQGILRIGAIRLAASDRIELRDVVIGAPKPLLGREPPPLARIDRIAVIMDWVEQTPVAIDIDGVALTLDRERHALLDRLLTLEAEASAREARAAPAGHADRPRIPIAIRISGTAAIPGVVEAREVVAMVTATGPRISGTAACRLHPAGTATSGSLALSFRSLPPVDGLRAYEYRIDQGNAPAARLIDAGVALGITGEPGPALRRWLPGEIEAAGTVIVNVPAAGTYTGPLRARWRDGRASGELRLGVLRGARPGVQATVEALVLDHAGLGRLRGGLEVRADGELRVTGDDWAPGPELGIPEVVPVAALRAALPELEVAMSIERAEAPTVVTLRDRARGRLRIDLRRDSVRISGSELPLELARPFVPEWLAIRGGVAGPADAGGGVGLALAVERGELSPVTVRLRQARLEALGWSLGPIDGSVRVRRTAAGWTIDADTRDGRVVWTPQGHGGRLDADLQRLQPLAARLQGPFALPDLRGSASGSLAIAWRDDGWDVHADRLVVRDAGIPDLFADVDAGGQVHLAWRQGATAAGSLRLEADGQLLAGALRLPGLWLDLGRRTPLAGISAVLSQERGERYIILERLMARPSGSATAGGWSASLRGSVRERDGTGTITGTIDRVDLGWLMAHLPGTRPDVLTGEGAAVVSADLVRARPTRIEGTVLPLSAGIDLGNGLRLDGLTGAIGFTITPP